MKRILLSGLLLLITFGSFAQIDFGGIIKNKTNQRAKQKTNDAVDKALDEAEGKNKKGKTNK